MRYKIIIPKEEPRQETLEEVAERFSMQFLNNGDNSEFEAQSALLGVMFGAKWQQQQNKNLYSEDDLKEAFMEGSDCDSHNKTFYEWFEKFKKQ